MSLKPQADKIPFPKPALPSWGVLTEPSEPASVIRFECHDGSHSYPYHTLSSWTLHPDKPDTLLVCIGREVVKVTGERLEIIRDALDTGRLSILRISPERYRPLNPEGEVMVAEIEFQKAETGDLSNETAIRR